MNIDINSHKEDPKKNGQDETQKDEIVELKAADIEKLKNEVREYKDKYLRLYAEFENARKRMDREKMEFVRYANEGLVTDFLSILDNFELTVKVAQEKHQDYDAFLKGIEMVLNQTNELLKKNGVTPIDAAGKPFDPHCHEIMMQEETDQYKDSEVIEELQKGYFLDDKVIRTSKVKIARNNKDN